MWARRTGEWKLRGTDGADPSYRVTTIAVPRHLRAEWAGVAHAREHVRDGDRHVQHRPRQAYFYEFSPPVDEPVRERRLGGAAVMQATAVHTPRGVCLTRA